MLQYAAEALGYDATLKEHEFVVSAMDDGSVVSLGGYPFFDQWKLIDLDTGGLLLDDCAMLIVSQSALKVRCTGELAVSNGEKIFVGLESNVFKPAQPDQQSFFDHQYRVAKTPYVEGEILDGNGLTVPAEEIAEDMPLLGDPFVVVAGT